jgi:cytoskeletal protein RodZ
MALDTSGLGDFPLHLDGGPEPMGEGERPAPSVEAGADIGQALRAAREARGFSIAQLAETTRVRSSYLAAIEAMRLEALPSRPFVIGYIRAYAQALGLDPEAAAERFKAEEPVLDEPLPAPVGVPDERDPRLATIIVGAMAIIAAIVTWNVVQRIMTESAPPPPTASEAAARQALAQVRSGPVELGAPLPAPIESTTPPPYVTPGIENAKKPDGTPLDPSPIDAAIAAAGPPQPALAASFQPKGPVFGAAPKRPAAAILQALKPALLVIHGADGTVYFARQLAEGEAYRVPQLGGLVVDVSEPEAFQVFVGGQSKGVLPAPLTAVSRLVGAPPAPKAAAPKPAAPAAGPTPVAAAPRPAGPAPAPVAPKRAAAPDSDLPPT